MYSSEPKFRYKCAMFSLFNKIITVPLFAFLGVSITEDFIMLQPTLSMVLHLRFGNLILLAVVQESMFSFSRVLSPYSIPNLVLLYTHFVIVL